MTGGSSRCPPAFFRLLWAYAAFLRPAARAAPASPSGARRVGADRSPGGAATGRGRYTDLLKEEGGFTPRRRRRAVAYAAGGHQPNPAPPGGGEGNAFARAYGLSETSRC